MGETKEKGREENKRNGRKIGENRIKGQSTNRKMQ